MKIVMAAVLVAGLALVASPAAASDCPPDTMCSKVSEALPTIRIEIPGPVETVNVPGPVVTVPAPAKTVVVPGPEKTVSGPVRTVPGPTVTVRGPKETVPGPTLTVAPPIGQVVEPSATLVPSPVDKPGADPEVIETTVTKVASVSIGLVALGMILALGALALAYRFGVADGEGRTAKFLREITHQIRRETRKDFE